MLKPGGYSFQGLEMRYSKPALAISDQAQLLLDRGLICDDRQRLEHYLSNIGYYRLSAYLLPFEQASINDNSRNHKFLPGTTFEQVLNLYVFDRCLLEWQQICTQTVIADVGEVMLQALAIRADQASVQQALCLIRYGKGWLAITHFQPLK